MRRTALLAAALLVAAAPGAHEFRSITPIERASDAVDIPARGAPLAAPLAVSRLRVDYAMRQVVRTWNREYGGAELSLQFRDRDRLLDALQSRVPREARLTLIGIESSRVLGQAVLDTRLRTTVAVLARTRIDFVDERGRKQSREGVNEYHLTLEDMTQ